MRLDPGHQLRSTPSLPVARRGGGDNRKDGIAPGVLQGGDLLGGGVYAFVPHIGLSLTYDHRSLDGGEATRFLKQIAIEIENLELTY